MNIVAFVWVWNLDLQLPFFHEGVVRAFYRSFPAQPPKLLYNAPPFCDLGQRHYIRYSMFRSISSITGRSRSLS